MFNNSAISIRSELGFTLIELMVALAVGLVVAGAILITQLKLTQQNTRIADTFNRDTEARAAMDIISHDISGSGFLMGSTHLKCSTILSYDSQTPSPFFSQFGVSALTSATQGTQLPFVATPGITLTYPAAGVRSDVLIVGGSADSSQFTGLILGPNPTIGYGPLNDGKLPVVPDTADSSSTYPTGMPQVGDVGILWMPVGTAATAPSLCIRAPITATGSVNGIFNVTSGSGQWMPANFYSDFSTKLATAGFTASAYPALTLSNGMLQTGSLIDAGQAANSNQFTYAYYIDQPAGSSWPTLMRAKINALNDQVVANSTQAVAAGVVSLQTSFGVDTTGAGTSVTQYMTWANVLATGNAPNVRTVKIAIISRSLQPDASLQGTNANQAGSTVPAAGSNPDFTGTPSATSAGFTPYTITAADKQYRFFVQQTEIAVTKNCAANSAGSC